MNLTQKYLAKFKRGKTVMSTDFIDFVIYNENLNYFSMIPFDKTKCVHNETILKIESGNGYQSVSVVESVPVSIDGFTKF